MAAAGTNAGLAGLVAAHAGRIEATETLLQDLADLVDTLRAEVEILAGADGPLPYRPAPSPRLWEMDQEARGELCTRLAAWADQVYVPGYGHEAARLPRCWQAHDFCLLMLDSLSELWSCLYLAPRRTPQIVSAQAEWQTRILPAAAEAMAAEGAQCQHALPAPGRRP
jgi:hypothetical protein